MPISAETDNGRGNAEKLTVKFRIRPCKANMPHISSEQPREEKRAENLAAHHAREDEHGDSAIVAAAIFIQQKTDREDADKLLPDLGAGCVLYPFQADKQRFENIFYAGERQAQQHVRKRARTASITEQICRDTAAAQQNHRCAGRTQRKRPGTPTAKPRLTDGSPLLLRTPRSAANTPLSRRTDSPHSILNTPN